uniref:Transcription activation suppressor family member 2 n=1 Tax=Poecilia formosa TaxID=48698 RepID=A0A096MD55_POEFO
MESRHGGAPREGFLIPVSESSDVFQSNILAPLQSAYLYEESKQFFRYKSAVLVKNPDIEDKYNAFRARKTKAGYSEDDLKETYGFLLFDDSSKANALGQTGIISGNSTCTTLGDPAKGVYISMYSDCLDINRWYHGKSGYIAIIRLTKVKGKVKKVAENYTQHFTEPTVGYDCHVSDQLPSVSSKTSSFLAFERTQFYIYELLHDGSSEASQSPSTACPFAIVSFSYMDTKASPVTLEKSSLCTFASTSNIIKKHYLLWRGQLQIQNQIYHIDLRSTAVAFIPVQLPLVIKVDQAIHMSVLRSLLPRTVFETSYTESLSVFLDGFYCDLCEFVSSEANEASSFALLLSEIKRKDFALIIPLIDGGFLILMHSSHFLRYDDVESASAGVMQGLFVFPDSRFVTRVERNSTDTKFREKNCALSSEILRILPLLSYAEGEAEKTSMDPKDELCEVLTEHMQSYATLINPGFSSSPSRPSRELGMFPDHYDVAEAHRHLYSSPEWNNRTWETFKSYLSKPNSFELPVAKVSEILASGQEERNFPNVANHQTSTKRKKRRRIYSVVKKKVSGTSVKTHSSVDFADQVKSMQCTKKGNANNDCTSDKTVRKTVKEKALESAPKDSVKKCDLSKSLSSGDQDLTESPDLEASKLLDLSKKDNAASEPESGILDLSVKNFDDKRVSVEQHPNKEVTLVSNKSLKALSAVKPAPGLQEKETFQTCTKHLNLNPIETCAKDESPCQKAIESERTRKTCLKRIFSDCFITINQNDSHFNEVKDDTNIEIRNLPQQDALCSPTSVVDKEVNSGEECNVIHTGVGLQEKEICQGGSRGPSPDMMNRNDESVYKESDIVCNGTYVHEKLPGEQGYISENSLEKNSVESPNKMETSDQSLESNSECEEENLEQTLLEVQESPSKCEGNNVHEVDEQLTEKTDSKTDESSSKLSKREVLQEEEKANLIMAVKPSKSEESQPHWQPKDIDPKTTSQCNEASGNSVRHLSQNSMILKETKNSDGFDSNHSVCKYFSNTLWLANISSESGTEEDTDSLSSSPPQNYRRTMSKLNQISSSPSSSVQCPKSEMKKELDETFRSNLNAVVKKSCKTKYRFFIMVTSDDIFFKETKAQLETEGHTAVQPSEFFLGEDGSSSLLIILRNEDIAEHICKIPHLLKLKMSPGVLFAGVDEPDDVINLTHQELFIRAGFVMFDRAVLEPLSVGNMKKISKILQELSGMGKWKWMLHYRDSRRLKENARLSEEANEKKLLMYWCQDAGILDVLPYHECDQMTREQPDYLACLLRLQVQHVSSRFLVFITDATTDGGFEKNGILTMTLNTFLTVFIRNIQSLTEEG